ncbi:telomere-protecting terminal protein Tpg [Streptomyces sp. NPDC090083]|uniref:telomere-protecting terminal protein Tpg n=1 Tax=Streptomyces sp. NPDC090083 TaxID=3365941 RepID=UPI0037FE519F
MARRIRPTNADRDDAIIGDAVERASQEKFTREPPKTLQGRINFLLRQLRTTKAVAAELGISQRSVERYRKGDRKHPPKAVADRLDAAVRARWQPRVRFQKQKEAATTGGITVETRARFGYDAPGGTTDDGRFRRLTVRLSAAYARRLFDAQQGRSNESPNEVIAEGLQEHYFKDNGLRADHLEVEFTDIDYIDIEY